MKTKVIRGFIIVLAVVVAVVTIGAFAKIAISHRYHQDEAPNDSQNTDQKSPKDKEIEQQQWEEYQAARSIYYRALKQRKPELLIDLPYSVYNPIEDRDVELTQAAIEFFRATADLEVIDMGEFFTIKPYGTYTLENPAKIDLWHKSNHYTGGIIAIIDEKNNLLAKYQLPEISSNNDIYRAFTIELPYKTPSTKKGYILGYGWNTKDGEDDIDSAVKIPITFSNN
jgi:hypothetical protein